MASGEFQKRLSELEQMVMDIVWRHDSVTTEAIRSALEASHPIRESAIRTILSRLEEKGYVAHHAEGRTNIYQSIEAPLTVAAHSVRQIIEPFCGGSVERLLVGMVDNEVVDEKELQRLARQIARRRKT